MSAFRRDRRGNVAMMWALMGAVLIGLVGLTVDFTRAQTIRAQLQNAADGAALAAARGAANLTMAQRTAAARSYFESEAGPLATGADFSLTDLGTDLGYRVNVSSEMTNGLTRLISNDNWTLNVSSEALRGGVNMEVALVLDTTGSMAGTKITALRTAATNFVNAIVQDVQVPYYSKVALVTYSVGVNAGTYATAVRGAIPGGRSMSAASWTDGTSRNITAATKASPGVFTSNNHGLQNGDVVWVSGIGSAGNWDSNLNGRWFTIANRAANTFQLRNSSNAIVNTNGYSGNYPGSGIVRRCHVAGCVVRVTASNHGFATGDNVFITGVNGMTQINNATGSGTGTTWPITVIDSNNFSLNGSVGPNYSAYANPASGSAFCTTYGCEYYRFTNASNTTNVFRVSTCTTERTNASVIDGSARGAAGQAYTDAAPGTTLLGLNYPSTASNGACPSTTVLPMTSNRTTLNSRISTLAASGYTAGHIGAAWGWYMISPTFGQWTGEGAPAAYDAPETQKVVVLMTDGEFNAVYCNGVIAANAPNAGNNVDHINCNAQNNVDGMVQARNLCDNMKARNIIVATVAFDTDSATQAALAQCATSGWSFTASNSADLTTVFNDLARRLSQLRLTH